MDDSGTFDTLFLCVSSAMSGAASYFFYRLFRSHNETTQQVRHITLWHPDVELVDQVKNQDNHYLDYAAVEGTVKELGRTMRSYYGNEEGVIMKSQVVEHRTKFENGFWVDAKRVIKDNLEMVPFVMVGERKDEKYKVEVIKPGNALLLQDELDTTYDHFERNKNWLNRIYGEFTKGFHVTEQMLLTGTNVLGIGKVFLEQGQLKLGPPDDLKRSYILTRMSLNEVINHYEEQSEKYKMLAVVAACAGGGFLAYAIYRHMALQNEQRRQRLEFEEIRRSLAQQRLQALSESAQITDRTEEQAEERTELRPEDTCVVCLNDVRQVISLPCGHFAMCAFCAEAIPIPKKCPVCRTSIDRFIPVYRP